MNRNRIVALTVVNVGVVLALFVAVPLPFTPHRETPRELPAAARAESAYDASVRALSSDDADDRRTAVRVLGALGDRRAVPRLEPLLAAPDADLSREAALALSRLTGDAAVVRALATKAFEDLSTVDAIGACPGPAADEELLALSGPRDPYVRGAAIKALARRSPAAAVPLVAEALASDEPPLRFHALEAALTAADPALAPHLRLLAASPDRLERRLALAALVRLGEPGAEAGLTEMAAEARRAGDPWVETLAAEALTRAGSTEGVRLWRAAVGGMHEADRAAAVSRFRGGFPESVRPDLRRLLADGAPGVRLAAALALGASGDPAAADVLRADAAAADRPTAADCAVVLASLGLR